MGLDFLVPIFGILVLLVPITGLTAVLTLRLGGKPFIETLARELGHGRGPDAAELREQIADLREEVEGLSHELHRLQAAQSFDRKLLDPSDAPSDGRAGDGSGVGERRVSGGS